MTATNPRPRSKSGHRGNNSRSKSRSKSQQARDSPAAASSSAADATAVPPVPAVVADASPRTTILRDPTTHLPIVTPPMTARVPGEDDPVTLAQRAIAANNKSKAIPILPRSPAKPAPASAPAPAPASTASAEPAAAQQPEAEVDAQVEEGEVVAAAVPPSLVADGSVHRYTKDVLLSLNIPTLPTPASMAQVHIFTRADDPNAGGHSGGHGGRGGRRGGHHRGGGDRGGHHRGGDRHHDRRHRNATHDSDKSASGDKDASKATAEGEWPRGAAPEGLRNSPRPSNRGSPRNRGGDQAEGGAAAVGDQSPSMSSRGGSRRGQQGARGVELLPEDLKPLEKSETAWVPEMRTAGGDAAATEEPEDEDAYRTAMVKQVRGLLNKLSPENFDKLKDKFLFSSKFPSAMTAVCELLVRKSYEEPKYASLYAKLTHYFYTNLPLPPGFEDKPEQRREYSAMVRRFIIVACQNQFLARPDWAERATGKISEEEYEEVVKIKSKALGNMKFVGELYVSGIINPKVMILIVSSLISEKPPAPKPANEDGSEQPAEEQEPAPVHDPMAHITNPKEEDIECVLTLLNTMGAQADSVLGTAMCDPWYDVLTEIYHQSSLISRIKFAIADLLDLRAARWARQWVQPGQGLEVRGKQVMAFSAEEKISSMSRQSSMRGSTRGAGSRHNSEAADGGWQPSPSSSSSGRRRDPNRYNSNNAERGAAPSGGDRRRGKSPSARGSGPRSNTAESASGASGKFAGGKSGSGSFRSQSGAGSAGRRNNAGGESMRSAGSQRRHGAAAVPATAAAPAAKKPTNVFDLLHGVGEQDDDENEEEDEEEDEEAEEEESAQPKVAQELTADPEEAPVELSDDELSTKAKAIVRNLFSSREPSEWVDDVKKVDHYAKQLVSKSLDVVSQEKVAEATLFGKALALGVQEGLFSLDDLVAFIAASEVIEFYEDIKPDVPQLDALMVAMLKEVAQGDDKAALEPVLKATGIAEL